MGHNIAFLLLTIALTSLTRAAGWRASKGHLYTLPLVGALPLCILWGGGTAAMFEVLILWLKPQTAMLWIFGYAQGAYASIPNYGLLNERTIPPGAVGRHQLVKIVPLVAYVVSMIAFTYLPTLAK